MNLYEATQDSALPPLDPMPPREMVRRESSIHYAGGLSIDDFAAYLHQMENELPGNRMADLVSVEIDVDAGHYDTPVAELKLVYFTQETDEEYTKRCQKLRYDKARDQYDAHRKIEAAKEVLRAAGITNLGTP